MFRNGPDIRDDGTVIEHSRVITWQRTVSESFRDDRSVVSARTTQSASKQALVPAASKAPSVVSKAPSAAAKSVSMARSVSEPVVPPQVSTSDAGDGAAKKIIGTLLGAAAGAAVAYAMVKSEQDSAKKEAEFVAKLAQAKEQPKLSMQDPQLIYEAQPSVVHRNISDSDSHYSSPQPRSEFLRRAIEPAPQSYHSPSYTSVPPTQVGAPRAIEYAPAYSVAPSRSEFAAHRSVTNPELATIEKARSTLSKVQSVVQSVAPSSLISTFVPDHVQRRSSEGSVASHHSIKSKAKSSHTNASRHTSYTKHTSSRSRAPSPPPSNAPSKAASKAPTKAGSVVGSILGRDAKSTTSNRDDFISDLEFEEVNDTDTVAPSDSISNAGSSSRRSHHRRHRSSSKHGGSVAGSAHSSASKHSKPSRHSHSSRKSHRSSRHEDYHSAADRPRLPTVVSEPSDASTVKPAKSRASTSAGRKDSVTQGQYDGLMAGGGVSYGSGTVASLPIRGITPSMINGGEEQGKGRSMISYAMGQRLRPFEGQ